MAETNGATGTQADPGTQPPAGDAKSQADDAGEQAQSESISLEEAKKLRAEANSLRRRLKDFEEAAQKSREAALSDHEKALAQARREGADEVLEKGNARIRRSVITAALTAAGANPDLLDLAVTDERFGALTVTEEGDVTGVKEAVAAVRKARPSLFLGSPTVGSADGGPRGTPATTPPTVDELLRAAVRGR